MRMSLLYRSGLISIENTDHSSGCVGSIGISCWSSHPQVTCGNRALLWTWCLQPTIPFIDLDKEKKPVLCPVLYNFLKCRLSKNIYLETESQAKLTSNHCVLKDDFELLLPLPVASQCRGHRHVSSYPVYKVVLRAEPRAYSMLGKRSRTRLCASP